MTAEVDDIMKTDKEWGEQVANQFQGLGTETRYAIATVVARIVRRVRSEMDSEAADVVEWFIKLTDDAATYRGFMKTRNLSRSAQHAGTGKSTQR